MRRVDRLRNSFETLGQPARGSSFRAFPLEHQKSPTSAKGSIKKGGRYNAKNAFEVLYTADGADTLLREARIVVRQPNGEVVSVPIEPQVIMTVDYDMSYLADLTDQAVIEQLGIDAADLVCDWELDVLRGRIPPTQEIGMAARLAGIEALRVPSALHVGSTNLIVIVDQLLDTSRIAIHDPKGFVAGTLTTLVGVKATRFGARSR